MPMIRPITRSIPPSLLSVVRYDEHGQGQGQEAESLCLMISTEKPRGSFVFCPSLRHSQQDSIQQGRG